MSQQKFPFFEEVDVISFPNGAGSEIHTIVTHDLKTPYDANKNTLDNQYGRY